MAACAEPRENGSVSDPFDPDWRRAHEEPPARDPEQPANDAPPPVDEQPPPTPGYGQAPPARSVYGEEPSRSEERPWSIPDEPAWPYRPESEQEQEPPPPPEPPHGLNPLVRLGVPQPWRGIIDWIVTIAGAIAIVLAIKAWVVNPYRIPSSSMEPTLHCARPGDGCTARFSDRVLACRFCYRLWSPKRGDIVVFKTPLLADKRCGAGGTFVKRLIGLPGETWEERGGDVYIDGKR